MIDSHCHLDIEDFEVDRSAVLQRAYARGVTDIIVPAVDERSWTRISDLTRMRDVSRIHAALGIHPVALPTMPSADDDLVLVHLATAIETYRPVAIGECGLDTTIDLTAAPLDRQTRVLTAQLTLASQFDLPVVLHARGPGCYARLLEALTHQPLPARGGVLHSYGGGVDLLRNFLTLPLYFGFAGPATYPNARKVRASIQLVPSDRLLAETDAPDQSPEPHRPGRSEPAYVAEIVQGLAGARGVTVDTMAELTTTNARRLFHLA